MQLRVFHLIKSLGRGGAEMLLRENLRFADRANIDYAYGYFLPWKDALVLELQREGVQVTCFGARNNAQIILSANRLAAYLRQHNVNVMHCHLPIAGVVGRIAGWLAGVPVVYSEHNTQEHYALLTRELNRVTWHLQKQAIAVSADVAQSIRTHIRSSVPITVVPNGVDTTRFSRQATSSNVRTAYQIPNDAPVVGTVAVFRKQKRLDEWLRAAALIRERFPTVRFLLVGDGPLRGEVTLAINAAGMQDVVHLPGSQQDVRPYLAAMDVYMMASAFEGLPVALLEAMSMECAPACTAVGGIPEAITSGENGVLTEPHQVEALADAVCGLLAQPEQRLAIAAAARHTVEARFSVARMSRELEAIYREVAHEHAFSR